MLKYLLQFVIGGGVIVGMSVLSKHMGAKYAAALYAVPSQFTLGVIFIYLQSGKSNIQLLSGGAIYALVCTMLFVVIFKWLLSYANFWISLGTSYVLFFGLLALFLYLFPGESPST